MKRIYILFLVLAVLLCIKPNYDFSYAQTNAYNPVTLTTDSVVSVNKVFGEYQSAVDENIYYSMSSVSSKELVSVFGNANTPMFEMAKETINPCMAFGTTWGEAGSSYKGISLTTVMDFNPNTYVDQIDWLSLSRNLEQVDSSWYISNAKQSYNTNESGNAYHMPNALLQAPKGGDRSTHDMQDLGVGPYQITSSDWDKWILDNRVNPIWGFEDSLRKCGTDWIYCGISPISDLTVYAALSLGHQGGNLITQDFGKRLISTINTYDVQIAIDRAGHDMFMDLLEKAYNKEVSLSDIDVGPYVSQVESETGIKFSTFHAPGFGQTNKGTYVLKHCIRYVFYKYYFTSGDYNKQSYKANQIWENESQSDLGLSYQSDYAIGTHEHVAYKQTEFIHDINGNTSIAGAGCGWCSLTSAMAELNPAMCGGITPVDWLDTPMSAVGSSYWGSGGMSWGGPDAWISTINDIGIYGKYSVLEGGGASSIDVVKAIMKYADDPTNVVVVSASPGLFTSGGHIMCVTDLNGDYFHIADSSTRASDYLGIKWEDMSKYDFPGIIDGVYQTSIDGYNYNFKGYWVIHREE